MIINLNYAEEGMELAQDVYFPGNINMPYRPKGYILTKSDIERFKNAGITTIKVVNKGIIETVPEHIQSETLKLLKSINYNTMSKPINVTIGKEPKQKTPVQLVDIYSNAIVKSVVQASDFRFDIEKYDKTSREIYARTISIAAFAVNVAKYYNTQVAADDQIDLKELCTAVLLSEIGHIGKQNTEKLAELKKYTSGKFNALRGKYREIPENALDEYNELYHSLYSYLMLSEDTTISSSVKQAILFHHENATGTGFLHITKDHMKEESKSKKMSKIIRVCDVYDIILQTTNKTFSNSSFSEVPKKMDALAKTGVIDSTMYEYFKKCTPLYSNSLELELNDGEIVSVINPTDKNILEQRKNVDLFTEYPFVVDDSNHQVKLEPNGLQVLGPINSIKNIQLANEPTGPIL